MTDNIYSEKIINKLKPIMRDQGLAKYGDTVANYIYSQAKTNILGKPFGERVFDKALAEAIRNIGLREVMPSSISTGKIGDGVEALIGFSILEKILSIDDLIIIIEPIIKEYQKNIEIDRKIEREVMIKSFEDVINQILKKIVDKKILE